MSEPATNLRINERQRELLEGTEEHAYKALGGGDSLSLRVFSPKQATSAAPTIVFFYGGGFWERGELSQFAPQCLHFAERGVVAILADYRLGKVRGATPLDGVEDARDAIAWISANARRLGIDPNKIVAAGASSGAHVVLAATMMASGDDTKIEPAAMVLFSPIVNLLRGNVIDLFGGKRSAKMASPLHLVRKKLPPVLMFHGTEDRVQSVGDVETFAKKLMKKKNHCELNVFNGERSSYFNFNVNPELYETTLNTADDFLVRGEILDGGGADGAATTRLDSWR